jgi:beta-galactosidase
LTFTNVKNDATASNGVIIAEVQLLGSLPAAAPGIVVEPPGNEELLAGATFDPAVVASGAGPITYKWTFGSTPIPGATNAMLVITNISSTNDGNYFCTVINSFGSNNSGTVSLNVVQPSV